MNNRSTLGLGLNDTIGNRAVNYTHRLCFWATKSSIFMVKRQNRIRRMNVTNQFNFNWFERITRFYSTLFKNFQFSHIFFCLPWKCRHWLLFSVLLAQKKECIKIEPIRFRANIHWNHPQRNFCSLPSSFCTSIYYIKAFFVYFAKHISLPDDWMHM